MDLSILKKLFLGKFGIECLETSLLVPAGSARQYFRLSSGETTAVGAFNNDIRENTAFLSFTKHFLSRGLSVPVIYAVSEDKKYYLLEDLGDTSLKEMTDKMRKNWEFPAEIIPWYKKVIDELMRFQHEGHEGLDYSVCIPRDHFDGRSILWDLNHFKYFFLKLSGIPFNEDRLEDDFTSLAALLDKVDRDSFLFRDFQSRNIMIKSDKLYFIDYQGGRRGALQYDIATLLFEARTNMDQRFRDELLEYYMVKTAIYKKDFNSEEFLSAYLLFALVRQLQAMGAYGLRGWVEKKPLFLQSVPFAMKNISYFLSQENPFLNKLGELSRILKVMSNDERLNRPVPSPTSKLCVRIYSFSYRKSIPDDLTGEGGGYVFDCRGIHNPGHYPEFKNLTGLDEAVGTFFQRKTEMEEFLKDVFSLTDRSIKTYVDRGFRNLQVSFGCTGGQHRSVYAAKKLAEHLEHNSLINVLVEHLELKNFKPAK